MPPTVFPPTPAPSTDIKGKEALHFPGIDNAFELPPAAVSNHEKHQHKATNMPASPESSQSSPYQSEGMTAPDLTSPPATSRSRKTSQVKRKNSTSVREEREDDAAYVPAKPTPSTSGRGKAKDGNRGKAGAATSAQGRKVARKTAHSIIERRRRSKMNEEFGVLKDLIPACRGVEMHKLAILQASIDYLRHLESNISHLKAGRAQSSEAPSLLDLSHDADDQEDELDDEDNNDKMQLDEDDLSPTTATHSKPFPQPQSQSQARSQAQTSHTERMAATALSPTHHQTQSLHRTSTSSTGSTSTTQPSPYFGPLVSASSATTSTSTFSRPSYSASSTTSPIFGPYYSHSNSRSNSVYEAGFGALPPASIYAHNHHRSNSNYGSGSRAGSLQTSPVIVPKDQGLNEAEASTALLMLNKDRRHSSISVAQGASGPHFSSNGNGSRGGGIGSGDVEGRRGMSVRDLLGS